MLLYIYTVCSQEERSPVSVVQIVKCKDIPGEKGFEIPQGPAVTKIGENSVSITIVHIGAR